MVILFTEEDLVSFGNFMLDPQREEVYKAQGVTEEQMPGVLKQVNTFDVQTWAAALTAKNQVPPAGEPEQIEESVPTQEVEG